MSLNVLIIEDSPSDAEIARSELECLGECKVDVVDRLSAAEERLKNGNYDIVIVDCGLPDSQGFATMERVKELSNGTHVYVHTGMEMDRMLARRCQAHRAIAIRKGYPSSLGMTIGTTYRPRSQEQQSAYAHMDSLRALLSACPDTSTG